MEIMVHRKGVVVCVAILSLLLAGCDFFPGSTPQSRKIDTSKETSSTQIYSSNERMSTSETGEMNSQSPRTKVYLDTSVENVNEDKMLSDKETIDNKNDYNQSSSNEILSGKVICLDPGHGITSQSKQERISPNSSETKSAYVSGASGEYQTEEELNLAVSKLVKNKLEDLGAKIIMTRTSHNIAVSNIERAEMANEADADICVRIHADGIEDSSVHGFSILVPAGDLLGTPSIVAPSREAAEFVEEALTEIIDAKNRGIVEREDLTGFNWSEVPVILVEMGFLSNPEEDEKMATEEYREKIAEGIANGVKNWLTE